MVRRIEGHHIDTVPDGEREEIRQIFMNKGFQDELLERAVEVITEDRRRWIDTMVTEEFGLPLETPSPLKAASATFCAFVAAGFVPLLPYAFVSGEIGRLFLVSSLATGTTFFLIGLIKGHIVGRKKVVSGLETLAVGSAAAGIAYLFGWLLKGILNGGP
jgi:VIT1/CCC1 family predicted Fe2+/Mn2+ transporter